MKDIGDDSQIKKTDKAHGGRETERENCIYTGGERELYIYGEREREGDRERFTSHVYLIEREYI